MDKTANVSDEFYRSSSSFDMQSGLIPSDESQAPIENLDQDFDFQIVVFKV